MMVSALSQELKVILSDILKIDESTKNLPIFDRESVEAIFWRLVQLDKKSGKKLADELSVFVSSLGRAEDQLLVTAEIPRPAARIIESDIILITALSKTESIFHRRLEQLDRSSDITLGLLLFSAIRFGGLLDKYNIEQFFHKLKSAEPPKVINKTAWYSFKHEISGNVIWLPDPLTLSLISQWLRNQKLSSQSGHSRKCFGWLYYINRLADKIETSIDKWQQTAFLRACSVRLAMDIAPALVDIANGTTPTCAFNQHSWLRLLTEKTPPLSKKQNQKTSIRETPKYEAISHLQTSFDAEILSRVGFICKNTSRINLLESVDRIRAEHEAFASMLSANTNLLFEWMIYRLLNEGSWSGPLKPSSAINRLKLLKGAFRSHKKFDDILLMDEDDVAELYETILESYQSAKQTTVAGALRDFHDFLVRNYDIAPNYTPDKYVLAAARQNKALAVDAEVLMPWDYQTLKSYLQKAPVETESRELVNLVLAALILCYRTGMRRSELLYLRVNDFSIDDENQLAAEIILKEHHLRSLKSPSAYRRLKIGTLLTPPELKFLIQLVNKRQALDGCSAFVFRTSNCERPYISAKRLFDPLTQLLKQVTGNPTMRPHHLRHSTPTWNFFRWMAPSSGKNAAIPTLTKLTNFEKVAAERREIIGVKDGLEPSRKALHALSMMMGHAHPTTTLRHYIHSSHIVLHDQLCLIQPKLQKRVLADLVGFSPRGLFKALQKQMQEDGADDIDDFKAWSIRDKCLSALAASQEDVSEIKGWRSKSALNLTWKNREPSAERLELIDYYMAAIDYLSGVENVTLLENRYAIFGSKFRLVLEQADKLLNLKMKVRKGNASVERYRHYEQYICERIDYSTGEITKSKEYKRQLPKLSRQIRERITIEKILVAVRELNQTQKDKLVKALEFFADNSNRRDHGITFKNRRPLDAFVSAIRTLNLTSMAKNGKPAERLRLTISAPQLRKFTAQSQKLEEYWNSAITFKRYQLDYRVKDLGHQYKNGLAEIDLMSVEAKTSESESTKRRIADAGFRVGLYILYVTQSVWNSCESPVNRG
jgi:integrase